MQSISNDYDLDEEKELTGRKHYGSLRVDKLTGSMKLTGASTDINLRNVLRAVSAIVIDNKYADIRLPITALKNYEVIFSGQYSSVFASFARRDVKVESETSSTIMETINQTGLGMACSPVTPRRANNNFTAIVGDVKKVHTVFTLTCTSCNVDFK